LQGVTCDDRSILLVVDGLTLDVGGHGGMASSAYRHCRIPCLPLKLRRTVRMLPDESTTVRFDVSDDLGNALAWMHVDKDMYVIIDAANLDQLVTTLRVFNHLGYELVQRLLHTWGNSNAVNVNVKIDVHQTVYVGVRRGHGTSSLGDWGKYGWG
jgi:hypothetical protein